MAPRDSPLAATIFAACSSSMRYTQPSILITKHVSFSFKQYHNITFNKLCAFSLKQSMTQHTFQHDIMYRRGPDSEFLKKILRLASMQERMDLPAKAQEENDLLEVGKDRPFL
jgi:hypothetical protein